MKQNKGRPAAKQKEGISHILSLHVTAMQISLHGGVACTEGGMVC